jgi:CubicO group peptidase (beta-lactamase class C family)
MQDSKFEAPPAGRPRFADVVRASVASGEIAGAVAAVATKRMVRMEAFGFQNQADRTPAELDTIYRLGSTAKAIFTAAALVLLEDKKIDLHQDICKWLPELADRRVLRTPGGEIDDTTPAGRQITIYDVLTFQLGIGMYIQQTDTPIFRAMRAAQIAPTRDLVPFDGDEFIARLAALPLAHQPGETFMYHLGDDVLRVLISRIAGQPLCDVLQERVLEPLSMNDTGCSVPRSKLHRFATAYFSQAAPGEMLKVWDEADGRFAQRPVFPNHLMSTAGDYLKFARMLLDQGSFEGRRILKPESVALMMTDHLNDAQKARSPAPDGFWQTRGWGMGATVYTRSIPGGPSAGSYSWFGGDGPHFLVDPRRGSAIVLMIPREIERQSDTQLGYDFESTTYRDLLGADAP